MHEGCSCTETNAIPRNSWLYTWEYPAAQTRRVHSHGAADKDCACPKGTPNCQGLSLPITSQRHANSATPPPATPKATSTDLWGQSRKGRGVLQRAPCFSKQLLTGSITVLWVISDLGQKSLNPDQQRERQPLSLRPYHSSHGSEPGTCRTAVLLSGCTDSAREARVTISPARSQHNKRAISQASPHQLRCHRAGCLLTCICSPTNHFPSSLTQGQRGFPTCLPFPSQEKLPGLQHTHRSQPLRWALGIPSAYEHRSALAAQSSRGVPRRVRPCLTGPYLIGSKLHSRFPFHQSRADLHNHRLDGVGAAPALRDRVHQ